MNSMLAVLTIVTIAAVTPGPNNFIVMSAAIRGGAAAAVPAMLGVVGGSIALLVMIWAGAGSLFVAVPEIQPLMRMAGAAYLVWLGIGLMREAHKPAEAGSGTTLPETALGVASFQLLNPKSWVLVLTAIAAVGGTLQGMFALMAIFAVIMTACLTLWALAGRMISHWLVAPGSKRGFDLAMGALLVGSAGMLLL